MWYETHLKKNMLKSALHLELTRKKIRIQLGLYADCAFCCSLLKSFAACQLISSVGM